MPMLHNSQTWRFYWLWSLGTFCAYLLWRRKSKGVLKMKLASIIGSFIAFIAFCAYALIPSILYGGYCGLVLANSMMDTHMPTLAVKIIVVGGMALGLVSILSLFLVVGAFVGMGIGYIGMKVMILAKKEIVSA